MANGIGSVWAANFGEDGKPNGVGSVWIANASAMGSGGATEEQVSALSAAIDYVSANAGTGYVPLTATQVKIGNSNTASYYSLVQGRYNNAEDNSFSQGYLNSAYELTLVQGSGNKANFYSLAQGKGNSANYKSFAQGIGNSAYFDSLAQGDNNSAQEYSISLGLQNWARLESIAAGVYNTANLQSMAVGYACEASNRSQACGSCVSATNSGMAIGTYNDVTTGAFVIGNGNSGTRSDCFIIDHSGNVSAAGKISANGVELELSNFVPYTASGVELPNSHFKVDTDGRAYKLEVLDYNEQALTTGDFSAQKTLNYPFEQDKHYAVEVPTTRIKYEVREYVEPIPGITPGIGNTIISGDVQNGICDFVYPSSGVTGKKFFVTWNDITTASLTTANCKLYTMSSVSPSGEYVLASDLNYISASYDNLYSAFTAYTASHP